MKKVICDVCGTAFPDSSDQCPICGCAKPVDMSAATDPVGGSAGGTTYTYVKGGRFSKANVRKRNKAAGISRVVDPEDDEEYYKEQESSGTKGLVIAVIVLLLAIIAVVIYIVGFILNDGPEPTQIVPTTTQTQTTAGTTVPETTQADLSCTGLELEQTELAIMAAGDSVQINAYAQPADTVDELRYSSSDPSIATVTDDGRVTAVTPGEVQITVSCGEYTAVCRVVCQFEVENTEPELSGNYAMFIDNRNVENRRYGNDVSISVNKTFKLEIRDLDTDEVLDVQWIPEKQNIVSISGNTVKGSNIGTTTVSCTIDGITYSCTVRVNS